MKIKDDELDELLKPVDADELELLLDELSIEWNELELECLELELLPSLLYDDDMILDVIKILQKTDNFYNISPSDLLEIVKQQLNK
jgi:hypothetical protein